MLQLLGDQIRSRRLAAGLTQESLAFKSGVHEVHLRRIERGSTNVSMATLMAVCEQLGCPMSELLADVEAAE